MGGFFCPGIFSKIRPNATVSRGTRECSSRFFYGYDRI